MASKIIAGICGTVLCRFLPGSLEVDTVHNNRARDRRFQHMRVKLHGEELLQAAV